MRVARRALAVLAAISTTAAVAGEPVATVKLHNAQGAGAFRVRTVAAPVDPTFRVDDPRSMLRSGYGGSMIDLFPFEGGKFHLSGGGRLFGRAGRPRLNVDPESMRYLPSARVGGLRPSRKLSPAMMVGYGRTVDQGLAIGIDAGLMVGRLGATPDRFARLNRRRLDSLDGRGQRGGVNELARVTMLYRF